MHTNEGLIPFISAIVYPIFILWYRNTRKSFSSSSPVIEEEIITSSVEFSPRYAYLRCVGNSLSSSFGASYMDGVKDDILVPSTFVISHT